MLALYIIGSIVSYLMVAGFGYRRAEALHRRICGDCAPEIGGRTYRGHEWPQFAWFMVGMFWPAVLPVSWGMNLSHNPHKISRDEKRRAKELEEAQHQAKIARYKAEEAASLDRELADLERRLTKNGG